MNKVYSTLAFVILSALSFSLHAMTITINVDNPENVTISKDYGTPATLVQGDNEFSSTDDYMNIVINATDGNFIKSVVRKSTNSPEYVSNMSQCNLYIQASNDGETFTVTTAAADEVRDATCRVYVDHASKVQMQRSGTYSRVELNDGWNDVKFISDTESPLLISSSDYYTPLYSVELNGEPAQSSGGTWNVYVKNDDEVKITSDYPDVYVPVHFVFAEGSEGCVTEVSVDDVAVENYTDENFTVKAGKRIKVTGDIQNWNFDSFIVNGVTQYFYGTYEQTVTEETTINIAAHKYSTLTVGITVDDPSHIKAFRGYSYNNDRISLNPGRNEIEFPETNTTLSIEAESGCYIVSITDGTNEYKDAYSITVTDGMELTVTTGAINRDKEAVLYIDDRSAATQYFNFARADRSSIDIATGYNIIKFYDGDNNFGLSWYGASYANVLQNGETVNPLYENSTTYELTLNQGDVIKVYLADNPKECNVGFTVEGEGSHVAVRRDILENVPEWANGFTVLNGTQLDIVPAEGHLISVKADGNPVTANADGSHTVIVNDHTNLTVNVDNYDSVDLIEAGDNQPCTIYNLQGIAVKRNVTPDAIDSLPEGIYIINGKKVLKK